MVAVSDVQVPANPYYALLIDEEGRAYEATLGGCEPALPNRLLEHGESARGWLTFDVPENSRKLQLAYAPRLTLLPERTNAPILSHDIVDELIFELVR